MKIQLIDEAGNWRLLSDGDPFFIKGAVGKSRLERLASLGANAVRMPGLTYEDLDKAHAAGLGVLVNLPMKAERDGMDYDDTASVETQHRRVMERVAEIKDHPAVMMWCIGNELDHVPRQTTFNRKVWPAVNDVARAIHEIDPDHPTLTAVGMGQFGKIADCVNDCPDLDLIGVNTYADIGSVHSLLKQHGWEKPYVFTEWGMSGAWQRPKTPWGAPFEESSSTKADCYRRRYQGSVVAHPEQCFGGFAFYWGWRHETTMSFYNTWDPKGNEMETTEVWRELWKNEPISPDLPHLYGVRVNQFTAPDPVFLEPGEAVPLEALADANAALPGMRLVWELRPEVEYAAYAGHGETLPDVVPEAIQSGEGTQAWLRAPNEPGPYRVFAHLYDKQNRFATANLPVHIGEL